jgi:hypothetical protein
VRRNYEKSYINTFGNRGNGFLLAAGSEVGIGSARKG